RDGSAGEVVVTGLALEHDVETELRAQRLGTPPRAQSQQATELHCFRGDDVRAEDTVRPQSWQCDVRLALDVVLVLRVAGELPRAPLRGRRRDRERRTARAIVLACVATEEQCGQ